MKAVIRSFTFVATFTLGTAVNPNPTSVSGAPVVRGFGEGVVGSLTSGSSNTDAPRRALKRASAIAISARGPRKQVRFLDDEVPGRGADEIFFQTSRWEDDEPHDRGFKGFVSGTFNNAVAKVASSLNRGGLHRKAPSGRVQQVIEPSSCWEDQDWDVHDHGIKDMISDAFDSAVKTATPFTKKIVGRVRIG